MTESPEMLFMITELIKAYQESYINSSKTNPTETFVKTTMMPSLIASETVVELNELNMDGSLYKVVKEIKLIEDNKEKYQDQRVKVNFDNTSVSNVAVQNKGTVFYEICDGQIKEKDKYLDPEFNYNFKGAPQQANVVNKTIQAKLTNGITNKVSGNLNNYLANLGTKDITKYDVEKCLNCKVNFEDVGFDIPSLEWSLDFSQLLKTINDAIDKLKLELDPSKLYNQLCVFIKGFGKFNLCPSRLPQIAAILPALFVKYTNDLMKLQFDWLFLFGPLVKFVVSCLANLIENIPKLTKPIITCLINGVESLRKFWNFYSKFLIENGKVIKSSVEGLMLTYDTIDRAVFNRFKGTESPEQKKVEEKKEAATTITKNESNNNQTYELINGRLLSNIITNNGFYENILYFFTGEGTTSDYNFVKNNITRMKINYFSKNVINIPIPYKEKFKNIFFNRFRDILNKYEQDSNKDSQLLKAHLIAKPSDLFLKNVFKIFFKQDEIYINQFDFYTNQTIDFLIKNKDLVLEEIDKAAIKEISLKQKKELKENEYWFPFIKSQIERDIILCLFFYKELKKINDKPFNNATTKDLILKVVNTENFIEDFVNLIFDLNQNQINLTNRYSEYLDGSAFEKYHKTALFSDLFDKIENEKIKGLVETAQTAAIETAKIETKNTTTEVQISTEGKPIVVPSIFETKLTSDKTKITEPKNPASMDDKYKNRIKPITAAPGALMSSLSESITKNAINPINNSDSALLKKYGLEGKVILDKPIELKYDFVKAYQENIDTPINTVLNSIVLALKETQGYIEDFTGSVINALKAINEAFNRKINLSLQIGGRILNLIHLVRFILLIYKLIQKGFTDCEKISNNLYSAQDLINTVNPDLKLENVNSQEAKNIINNLNPTASNYDGVDEKQYMAISSQSNQSSTLINVTDCNNISSKMRLDNDDNLNQVYQELYNAFITT